MATNVYSAIGMNGNSITGLPLVPSVDSEAASKAYVDSKVIDPDDYLVREIGGNIYEDAVQDYDGNSYDAVIIGNQVWMAQNLRTTHYADGTEIPTGSTSSADTAYKYPPNGVENNIATYGYLYNWPAVMKGASSSSANPSGVQGIAPDGWHVPSDTEWTQLTDYVSSQSDLTCSGTAANIAKALASRTGWNTSTKTCAVGNNPSANNATGFGALPAGYYLGSYGNFGYYAYFWSATEDVSYYAWGRYLYSSYADVTRFNVNKDSGFSVRCLYNGSVEDFLAANPKLLAKNKALISDANGKITASTVTDTELGYLSGVTSSVQTQLGGKQDTLVSGTNIKTINGTSLLGEGNISISGSGSGGGDVNIIETIKVNNTVVTPDANKAVNITVPTSVSQLTNDAGYTTNTGTVTSVSVNGSTYSPTNGNVDLGTISGGGSSVNEVEIVNFTVSNSNGTYTVDSCDTSLADIIGYVNAGKEVIGVLTYSNGSSAITRYSGLSLSGIVIFASSAIEYDQFQLFGSNNGSSDVWVMYVLNTASPGTLTTTSTSALSTASNEALSGSISLHKVAKTGTYSDLIGTPTIPTVNNVTITLQKNGTSVGSFTTNASTDKSINMSVNELPTVSSSDNGKTLVVTNGAWSAQTMVTQTFYTGTTAPTSSIGSNGDLYLQTS